MRNFHPPAYPLRQFVTLIHWQRYLPRFRILSLYTWEEISIVLLATVSTPSSISLSCFIKWMEIHIFLLIICTEGSLTNQKGLMELVQSIVRCRGNNEILEKDNVWEVHTFGGLKINRKPIIMTLCFLLFLTTTYTSALMASYTSGFETSLIPSPSSSSSIFDSLKLSSSTDRLIQPYPENLEIVLSTSHSGSQHVTELAAALRS